MCILLVEDNEMNRDMLSRRLARKGHTVLLAADGEEGIRLATTQKPELVLMDVALPGISGLAATRLLKSAKGSDARRRIAEELAKTLGGALDTATVLREFRSSAKGSDARRQTAEELATTLGGALDTATVLREFLSSDPQTASIPVIAITAHALSSDRELAREAGCDEFETKPVDFPRLLSKIEALAGHAHA